VSDDWTIISKEADLIFDEQWEVGLGYEAEGIQELEHNDERIWDLGGKD